MRPGSTQQKERRWELAPISLSFYCVLCGESRTTAGARSVPVVAARSGWREAKKKEPYGFTLTNTHQKSNFPTNFFIAKFVIEQNKMYVKNASRAVKDGMITPDKQNPDPKNPIIAAVIRNIGHSGQLSSGVRIEH